MLLGWWLYKHIKSDEESRSKMYNRIDTKVDELRKEIKELAEAIARLEGFHSVERNK